MEYYKHIYAISQFFSLPSKQSSSIPVFILNIVMHVLVELGNCAII